jgi:hypothetical protein
MPTAPLCPTSRLQFISSARTLQGFGANYLRFLSGKAYTVTAGALEIYGRFVFFCSQVLALEVATKYAFLEDFKLIARMLR